MSYDSISVLAAAELLVAGIYLSGVAMVAGAACVGGWAVARRAPGDASTVLGSLGPLPLLNAVWVVVAGGLLLGVFPTAELALFRAWAPVLLLGLMGEVLLLTALVLRRVGEASHVPFGRLAAAAGAVLIVSTSALTWAHDGQWHRAVLGAITQALASVAVGAAFCRTRVRAASDSLQESLNRMSRLTSRLTVAAATLLLAAMLTEGSSGDGSVTAPALAAVAVLAWGWASAPLPFRPAAVTAGWAATTGPQLARPFDYLRESAGDPATARVMAVIVLCLLPCLLLAQILVWWQVGRSPEPADGGAW